MQSTPMKFDPMTGTANPEPTNADEYRKYHGKVAWLYNPWTGTARDPRDIGSDVDGLLIDADQQPHKYVPSDANPVAAPDEVFDAWIEKWRGFDEGMLILYEMVHPLNSNTRVLTHYPLMGVDGIIFASPEQVQRIQRDELIIVHNADYRASALEPKTKSA